MHLPGTHSLEGNREIAGCGSQEGRLSKGCPGPRPWLCPHKQPSPGARTFSWPFPWVQDNPPPSTAFFSLLKIPRNEDGAVVPARGARGPQLPEVASGSGCLCPCFLVPAGPAGRGGGGPWPAAGGGGLPSRAAQGPAAVPPALGPRRAFNGKCCHCHVALGRRPSHPPAGNPFSFFTQGFSVL